MYWTSPLTEPKPFSLRGVLRHSFDHSANYRPPRNLMQAGCDRALWITTGALLLKQLKRWAEFVDQSSSALSKASGASTWKMMLTLATRGNGQQEGCRAIFDHEVGARDRIVGVIDRATEVDLTGTNRPTFEALSEEC